MLKLEVNNESGARIVKKSFQGLCKSFEVVLAKVIDKKLKGRDGLVDLVFIDDKMMKAMNSEYRKKDSPTDVLTFAYLDVTDYEKDEGDVIVADIFISVDTIKRQAKEKGHSNLKEMQIMFVHGLLHAFGFDHKNNKAEKEMNKWAKKVLEA